MRAYASFIQFQPTTLCLLPVLSLPLRFSAFRLINITSVKTLLCVSYGSSLWRRGVFQIIHSSLSWLQSCTFTCCLVDDIVLSTLKSWLIECFLRYIGQLGIYTQWESFLLICVCHTCISCLKLLMKPHLTTFSVPVSALLCATCCSWQCDFLPFEWDAKVSI